MTLDEIIKTDKPMLVPSDIAPLLGFDAHSIRMQAQEDATKLGFNVTVCGNQTRIPRLAFLRFMGVEI